jgi:hypothetical protein
MNDKEAMEAARKAAEQIYRHQAAQTERNRRERQAMIDKEKEEYERTMAAIREHGLQFRPGQPERKNGMPDDEKIRVVIEHLMKVVDGRYLENYGFVGDVIVYTSARGDSMGNIYNTKNDQYLTGGGLWAITKANAVKWYDLAEALCAEEEREFDDALNEVGNKIKPYEMGYLTD